MNYKGNKLHEDQVNNSNNNKQDWILLYQLEIW